jgi:hypothetical protein
MNVILEVEVDEATGNAYESLSADSKKDFILDVTEMMQNRTGYGRAGAMRIKQLLDEIRKDAGAESKFNPEILYELMRHEDE